MVPLRWDWNLEPKIGNLGTVMVVGRSQQKEAVYLTKHMSKFKYM